MGNSYANEPNCKHDVMDEFAHEVMSCCLATQLTNASGTGLSRSLQEEFNQNPFLSDSER